MQFQQSSVITIIMNYDNLSLNIHLQKNAKTQIMTDLTLSKKRNIFITEKCWGYVSDIS